MRLQEVLNKGSDMSDNVRRVRRVNRKQRLKGNILNMTLAIDIQNASVYYSDTPVLLDINMTVEGNLSPLWDLTVAARQHCSNCCSGWCVR